MRLLLIISLIFASSLSQASTIKLSYSVLFGYMKTMVKLDYQYATTAFYLIDRNDKSLCTIKNAQMQVDNNIDPVLFESAGRLLPFFSDQHRKDGGIVVIDIDDGKMTSSCDLQVTVMAKERELAHLNTTKLIKISEQLEGVLKKNAGMIGKYFLPKFDGIRLTLSKELNKQQLAKLSNSIVISKNNELLLSNDSFDVINKINELNLVVVRITPWLETK